MRAAMHTQVQKWGNSLGIRIPKMLANRLNLHSGSEVEIHTEKNQLVICKAPSNLDLMLEQINSKNLHHESFKDDSSKGNESW